MVNIFYMHTKLNLVIRGLVGVTRQHVGLAVLVQTIIKAGLSMATQPMSSTTWSAKCRSTEFAPLSS